MQCNLLVLPVLADQAVCSQQLSSLRFISLGLLQPIAAQPTLNYVITSDFLPLGKKNAAQVTR